MKPFQRDFFFSNKLLCRDRLLFLYGFFDHFLKRQCIEITYNKMFTFRVNEIKNSRQLADRFPLKSV